MARLTRLLLFGVMIAGLALAQPARAQVPVIDGASLAQLVQQLEEAKQQYQELVDTYNQLKQTYQALAQLTNVNTLARQLEQPLMQDSMPDTAMLPGLLDGLSPPSELGGNLGSLAQQYLQQNAIYQPQGQYFQARQLPTEAKSIAGVEAVATQNLQSLQAREADLPQIRDALNRASTIQQVASIQARLAAEQDFVQAQTAQAANLQVLAAEQVQARHEAQDEAERQSEQQTIQTDCTALDQLGSSNPECR